MNADAIRVSFERWLRSKGLPATRDRSGDRYADPVIQAQWVSWQECWGEVTIWAPDRCWVPRDLMERIRNALCYYGNKGSYESLPTGSVFTRLRGPRPTTHQLTFAAQLLLREIDQMRESK